VEARDNDITLFQRIRADDRVALNALFAQYYQKLCAFACTYLHNPAEAEEAVSDVFFNLWRSRHQLAIEKSLKAYLYTAVRNAALATLRNREPLFEDVSDNAVSAAVPDTQDPEATLTYRTSPAHRRCRQHPAPTLPPDLPHEPRRSPHLPRNQRDPQHLRKNRRKPTRQSPPNPPRQHPPIRLITNRPQYPLVCISLLMVLPVDHSVEYSVESIRPILYPSAPDPSAILPSPPPITSTHHLPITKP